MEMGGREGDGVSGGVANGVECEDGQWHSGNLALFQSTRRPKRGDAEEESEALVPNSICTTT